jgi:hypothetical protein
MRETRFGIVNRNGARGGLSEGELNSHSVYLSTSPRACQAQTSPIVDNFGICICQYHMSILTKAAELIVIVNGNC